MREKTKNVLWFIFLFCAVFSTGVVEAKKFYKQDVEWLAMNIYHEARNEPVTGQLAVAHVTINRVESNHYPNSIEKVVTQQWKGICQFSWFCDGKSDVPKNKEVYAEIYKLAENILLRYNRNDAFDITNGSTHYHAVYVQPRWAKAKKMTKVAQIGLHIFYRYEKLI